MELLVQLKQGTMEVLKVESGGYAAALGVKTGDVITAVNDFPCTSPSTLREILGLGKVKSITVARDSGSLRLDTFNQEDVVRTQYVDPFPAVGNSRDGYIGGQGVTSSTSSSTGEEAFRRAMLAELRQMNDRLRYMHYIMLAFGIVFIVIPTLFFLIS